MTASHQYGGRSQHPAVACATCGKPSSHWFPDGSPAYDHSHEGLPAPYYSDDLVTLYLGDARVILPSLVAKVDFGCVIVDPPWDDGDLVYWIATEGPRADTELVFTDARRMGDVVALWGSPAWCFTWDTMSAWNTGPGKPLQQTKFALWYGDMARYDRDAVLWGDPIAARDHPSTKTAAAPGRRLTDLWRESLRWLHHPGPGAGSAGTERFSVRQGHAALRHAKPLGWMRCLIGNTSSGPVLDPFVGSGTALLAARDLGRISIGVEIDEATCEYAARRLSTDGPLPGAVRSIWEREEP